MFATAILILIGVTGLGYLLSGTQIGLDVPSLQGFNFRGGFSAPPELTALIMGLTFYTATFIGENVAPASRR